MRDPKVCPCREGAQDNKRCKTGRATTPVWCPKSSHTLPPPIGNPDQATRGDAILGLWTSQSQLFLPCSSNRPADFTQQDEAKRVIQERGISVRKVSRQGPKAAQLGTHTNSKTLLIPTLEVNKGRQDRPQKRHGSNDEGSKQFCR